MAGDFESYCKLVRQWAEEKGIFDKSSELAQLTKTKEEVEELEDGIYAANVDEVEDAIGDIFVTLIIQAEMWGLDPTRCLATAYDIISKRKGQMVSGLFVKEGSL